VKYHYNRGGPVAQWAMDEGSGSVINDKSGNGNDGTLVNGTTWAQGKNGTALQFDGADDYAVVNDNAVLRTTGDWTRSIWVNSPVVIGGDGTTNDIWTQRTTTNKFLLRIDAAGKWALYYRSTGAGFSSFFVARAEAGVWQNIVAVKSGTSIAFYIDGKKVASATNAENFPDDSHQIYFGSLAGGASQFFNGEIDEVKIYDYARTEEEIRLDYNAGLATHLGPSGKTCSEDPAGCMDFGLAGHWDMDEGSGSVINDKSGNNNHGALANGPKWTEGREGGALAFDGKDDYVGCGNDSDLNPTDALTIEFWAKTNGVGGNSLYPKLIHRNSNDGYHIYINRNTHPDGSKIDVVMKDVDGGYIFAHQFDWAQGRWHHIVVTYDREWGNVYIDNNLKTHINRTKALNSNSATTYIGGTNAGYALKGKIDGVKIYNRALSAEEVRYHYNQGKPVAQWDMDEGSGSVINDKSGNGNNGTLVNGTTWAQGKHGSALSFDGTDDYVSTNSSDSLNLSTNNFSIGAWVKHPPSDAAVSERIVYKSDGTQGYYLVWKPSTKRFEIGVSGYFLGPYFQLDDNNWHYVSAVFNRSSICDFYVDGKLIGSVNISSKQGSSVSNNSNLYIGNNDWYGQIDDVKIYDYARTEEEIRLDYNAGVATHLGPSGKTCSEDPAGCMDFGLAGHWDMDEGKGSLINDKSGNNNTGILTNGPQWTKGKNGSALQFDGKDDYVSVADSDSLTFGNGVADSGFSIESWVRYDVIGDGHSLLIARKNNEYALTNNNWLRLYLYDRSTGGILARDAIYLVNTYKKGEWIHLIVTYDGSALSSGIKFYLDGKLYNGGTPAGSSGTYVSMENTADNLEIAYPGTDAALDGVKIYNRALSAEEVRYHYNQGKPVAQWDFDEGEGARAFDVSGNNNTGVLTNGPTWVEGKHGSALSFDGTDDSVDVANDSSLGITSNLTIEAWVNPSAITLPSGMWMSIAGKKDGHNLSGYGLVMASYSPCRRWCFVVDNSNVCPANACEQIGR
jgi:hypothetical protein